MKDEHTYCKKMARNGRNMVIYKGTFISNHSLEQKRCEQMAQLVAPVNCPPHQHTANFLPHENYGDWELRGPCRENLHYLWKNAVRLSGKPHNNYRTCNYHGVSPHYLQPFSIDSAGFP